MLDDREVFGLIDLAEAVAMATNRENAGLFDFVAEAQLAGIVPYRPVEELTGAEADRLRKWMRGCGAIARLAGDPERLSAQAMIRLHEARVALERGLIDDAILGARLAEAASAALAAGLVRMEERAGAARATFLEEAERWR